MKNVKIMYALLLALCVFFTCGDACRPVQQTGSPGFPVDTVTETFDTAGNYYGGGPVSGQAVSGTWLSDVSGASGTIYQFSNVTNDDGTYLVSNGRIPANWSLQVLWNPLCNEQGSASAIVPDLTADGYTWDCVITIGAESANASTHFVLPGSAPSTITSYGDFSTTYGEPQLRVYVGGSTPGFVSSVSASSVVPGSSAIFPFPTQSNGSALPKGFYSLANTNVASGGGLVFVNPSYLAVGGTTTLSSAFGVDAADIKTYQTTCDAHGCTTTPGKYAAAPILTQYYADDVVSYTGTTIPVGIEPVAVKAWGSYLGEVTEGLTHYYTLGPSNAIVANSGSSSVSIVSFSTNTDVANITVGAQPMALTLNSGATYAYVASYGNGTLAEIDLSAKAVTSTATGLSGALSVAMDPSGSYVWVGGTNYIYKVSRAPSRSYRVCPSPVA